ncbi:formate dehydrogenase subunit alpha, partial [Candidatus Magnetaquicoccus inordinatus]|uniref:formate dehydrogenase subunit alpha n=1 Tax=Candidatus Magnetaquicoccus inordinatus TaxID=2496818 RepID=UPI00187D5455
MSSNFHFLTISINGTLQSVPPGTPLLQAFRQAGITVPTLCHAEHLHNRSRCGVCQVEEEGRGLIPACQNTVTQEASYRSDSPMAQEARKAALTLLLRQHPLNCLVCPVQGRCRLQQVALALGFTPLQHPQPVEAQVDQRHPFIHRQTALCIRCGLCVTACRDLQGAAVLGSLGRGADWQVSLGDQRSLLEAGCLSCGGCLLVCPTGALREPEPQAALTAERQIATTCGYCAVGCRLLVSVAGGKILRSEPDPQGSANRGHACVKGRFGHDFVHSPQRLTRPLLRNAEGVLQESDWSTALAYVAEKLTNIRDSAGPQALAVVSSARCSNEENYLLQKFARLVLQSNHIDNCARVCHSPSAFALGEALGTGAGTSSFEDVDRSDLLLLVGANPTDAHPVLGARIVQAVRNGCRLIVIDPRRTELAARADLHLALRPGSNLALLNALQWVLLQDNLLNESFVQAHCQGLESLWPALAGCTPEWAEEQCAVPAKLIRQAAHLYAGAKAAQILWGLGITESCNGSLSAFALINMALLTGHIGRPGTGASPIRGQNNVQGACDMGALPNVLTDYQPVSSPEVRQRYAQIWGAEPPATPGMKMPEMWEAAREGALQGLYLVAQDPLQSDPDSAKVREALGNLQLLVVQDIFLSESARYAHVVLPGCSFLEKRGTFVNSDRRVQALQEVVPPVGDSLADGEIVLRLAEAMGYSLGGRDAESGAYAPELLLDEIAQLSPNWGGISWQRILAKGFIQWPCPESSHPGTALLHQDGHFLRGKGRLTPTPWRASLRSSDPAFPFLLSTGRTLYHYNVGTMTRRSAIMALPEAKEELLQIHPQDAAQLALAQGEWLRVISGNGSIRVRAQITTQVQPGALFMAFHFPQTRTNLLLNAASDEYTRCPEYKVTPVRLVKCAEEWRPAIFFDRDGVLNIDHGYVHRPDQFTWIEEAQEAIHWCNQQGYLVIVVTNQSGIGRGYYDEAQLYELTAWMQEQLAIIGAHIDGVYYCPHHPEASDPYYRQECLCRKPQPGMLEQAIAEWEIDR